MPPEPSTEVADKPIDMGTQDTPAQTPEASAAPPAAQEEPKSLADAIKAGITKLGNDGEGGSSPPAAPPAKAEAGKEPAKPADPEPDPEDAKLPFHTHPRWRKLQGELNELRPLRKEVVEEKAKATELDTALRQQEPVVQAYGRMRDFCNEHEITNEDVNEAFTVMAAMKRDPERAITALRDYLERLEASAGYVLPNDLAEDVDAGRITEDRAVELSRARAQQAAAQAANQRLASQAQQRSATTAQERRVEAANAASVAMKEAEAVILTNPDAATVTAEVHEGMELWLHRRAAKGLPFPTPTEAVNQMKAFYGMRLEKLRKTAPPRPPIPRPPSGGSAPARPNPAAATSMEGHLKGAILSLGG